MTVLAILQARMSSTRLPGKVMRAMLGQPMMGRQIERLRRSREIDTLAVATSEDPGDTVVADYAAVLECGVFRGSLTDVLGRYEGALRTCGPADHVVRVTADCPLTDWRIVDACIARHLSSGADYTSNTVDRTYPKGLDVEIVKAELLAVAAHEAVDPYEREHVTPFLYRRPDRFRIDQLTQTVDLNHLRWTVDTPADHAFACKVYEALHPAEADFDSDDILALPWAWRTDPDDPGPEAPSPEAPSPDHLGPDASPPTSCRPCTPPSSARAHSSPSGKP